MRAPALLLLCMPALAPAAPIDVFKPMAYLVGHCWKGSVPATISTDEHCFEWILGGHGMRDTHTIRTPGKPDEIGETTYYWSPISKQIEYLYIDSAGGMSRGMMETVANTLFFPPAQRIGEDANGQYRVRWQPLGTNSYEAFSEKKVADDWTTMFKMTMTRTK